MRCRDIIFFSILTILSNCIIVSGLVSSCCKLLLSAIIISIIIKVKVMSHSELEILPFSKAISFAIYNGSWQLTTDS